MKKKVILIIGGHDHSGAGISNWLKSKLINTLYQY